MYGMMPFFPPQQTGMSPKQYFKMLRSFHEWYEEEQEKKDKKKKESDKKKDEPKKSTMSTAQAFMMLILLSPIIFPIELYFFLMLKPYLVEMLK